MPGYFVVATGTVMTCNCPVLDDTYRRNVVYRPDGSTAPMDVYIPREQGDLLYTLIRSIRPTATLEIGMANGLSTVFMARALADNAHGTHTAVDPFQSSDWGNVGRAMVLRAGLQEIVRVIEKPSHQSLPELEQTGFRADFVFVDGSHLFDYVLTDFLLADRLLTVGGLIAFDDSDWPAVGAVIRYTLLNRHYEIYDAGVVIEPSRHRPTWAGRLLRTLGKSSRKIGDKLRPSFLVPNYELGIRGRCVVIRKKADDDRDSQSRFHHDF